MIYTPHDLASVAELLPDAELSREHRAAVVAVLRKPQTSYRRAGAKLAVRANQIAASAAPQRARGRPSGRPPSR
jgi:hypothetical protein